MDHTPTNDEGLPNRRAGDRRSGDRRQGDRRQTDRRLEPRRQDETANVDEDEALLRHEGMWASIDWRPGDHNREARLRAERRREERRQDDRRSGERRQGDRRRGDRRAWQEPDEITAALEMDEDFDDIEAAGPFKGG